MNISQVSLLKSINLIKIKVFLEDARYTWVPWLGWMQIFFLYTQVHLPPDLILCPQFFNSSVDLALRQTWTVGFLVTNYCLLHKLHIISMKDGSLTGAVDIIPAFYSHWIFSCVWTSSTWSLGLSHSVATRPYIFLPSYFFLFLLISPLKSQT